MPKGTATLPNCTSISLGDMVKRLYKRMMPSEFSTLCLTKSSPSLVDSASAATILPKILAASNMAGEES